MLDFLIFMLMDINLIPKNGQNHYSIVLPFQPNFNLKLNSSSLTTSNSINNKKLFQNYFSNTFTTKKSVLGALDFKE